MALRFDDNKAGMQGLDKARISSIIERATANSRYGAHERRRRERIGRRVAEMRAALAGMSADALRMCAAEADALTARLERQRDTSRTIVHVDMDAFYAAVHMRDEPRLRTVPMAVGSDAMLSTSNYLARRYGVRAGMPGFIARKLCPQLTLVQLDFNKYNEAAERVRQVLREYDANLSTMGLDEAYMDVTDYLVRRAQQQPARTWPRSRYTGACECRLPRLPAGVSAATGTSGVEVDESLCPQCGQTNVRITDTVTFGGDVESVVGEMRFRIEQATGGLTASAGIACNTLLAKIGSDMNKPDGQYRLAARRDDIVRFMADLPVRKVSGIGSVTESMLGALGIATCADILAKRAELAAALTANCCEFLLAAALGIGPTSLADGKSREERRKSVSVERTFAADSDGDRLLATLDQLCGRLAANLAAEDYAASQITLVLKTANFDRVTKAAPSSSRPLSAAGDIFAAARILLAGQRRRMGAGVQLRLLGVRAGGLCRRSKAGAAPFDWRASSAGKRVVTDENERAADDDDDVVVLEGSDDDAPSVPKPPLLLPCPVCNVRIPAAKTEAQMARHVDACLSRRAVANVLREERGVGGNNAKRTNKGVGVKGPLAKCPKLDSYFARL